MVEPSRTLHYDHAMITVGEEGTRKNIEFLTDRQTHRQVGVIIVQSMKLVCLETSEKYHKDYSSYARWFWTFAL